MRTNVRWMIMAAVAGCIGVTSAAFAADAISADDPYLKVAAARARVEIVFRDGAISFDQTRNGWTANWLAVSAASQKICNVLLSQARQVEMAKGEQADKQFVADCDTKDQAARAAYELMGQPTGARTLAEQKFNEAATQWGNTWQLVGALRSSEEYWKNSKLDVGLLVNLYVAIEKRAMECREQANAAVAASKQAKLDWDAKLGEVTQFVATRVQAK